MIEEIKKFRVNWIDGMKISKDHFNDIQNYAQEVGKDVASIYLNRNNYGIIPSHLSQNSEFEVNLNAHNSISVSIQKLRAISTNGARIEINSTTPDVEQSFSIEELNNGIEEAYVMISINPNQDNAFGKQNSEEIPPRLPYVNNSFSFLVVDKEEIETSGIAAFQMPIAKIKKMNGSFEVIEKYIPPCITISADQRLLDFYSYTESFLNKIENNCIRIVKKIRMEDNINPIADTIQNVSAQLLTFLGPEITNLKSLRYYNTPTNVINTVMSMARIMKNHIDTYDPKIKESLFIYFGEWTDLKGGDFEKLFTRIINLEYTHYDVFPAVKEISIFIETITKLFDLLTEIDYIGQKKDTGLFVNENKVDQGKTDSAPSFLAD